MLSIFLAFSFALVALGGAAQEEGLSALNGVKIGYVDLVRAMAECEAGKKAQDQLKKEVENSEQRLLKQRERVEQLKDELEKKGHGPARRGTRRPGTGLPSESAGI